MLIYKYVTMYLVLQFSKPPIFDNDRTTHKDRRTHFITNSKTFTQVRMQWAECVIW